MKHARLEKYIMRLLEIVKNLYYLKKLKVSSLSEEYEVSEKTIRRNLKLISKIFPLLNHRGVYSLDISKLHPAQDTLQHRILSAFASNANILVKGFDQESISYEKITFSLDYNHLPQKLAQNIMHCIEIECKAEFVYKKSDKSISRRVVSPIKFYTERERWYLLAKDDKDGIVKTFYLGKIFDFKILAKETMSLTCDDIQKANSKKSIWSDSQNINYLVKVYVKPEVSEYFLDGKLHKSQKIHDNHCDGGLEVHYMITHKMELLPKIKSYIPHLFILEPKWLWEELMQDLEYYRSEDSRVRDI